MKGKSSVLKNNLQEESSKSKEKIFFCIQECRFQGICINRSYKPAIWQVRMSVQLPSIPSLPSSSSISMQNEDKMQFLKERLLRLLEKKVSIWY